MRGLDTLPTVALTNARLRPLQPEDAPALLAYYQNPNLTRYLDWYGPRDLAHASDVIRIWNEGFYKGWILRLAIADLETDRIIGTIFLSEFSGRRAELGYELNQTYWRRGITREAVQAVLDIAFASLDLVRVQAFVHPHNTSSAGLLLKLGFSWEGRLRQYETHTITGQTSDMDIFSIISEKE